MESIIALLEPLDRDDRLSLFTEGTEEVKVRCGISSGVPEQRYVAQTERICKLGDTCIPASLNHSDQHTGKIQSTPGENIAVSSNSIPRSLASTPL